MIWIEMACRTDLSLLKATYLAYNTNKGYLRMFILSYHLSPFFNGRGGGFLLKCRPQGTYIYIHIISWNNLLFIFMLLINKKKLIVRYCNTYTLKETCTTLLTYERFWHFRTRACKRLGLFTCIIWNIWVF